MRKKRKFNFSQKEHPLNSMFLLFSRNPLTLLIHKIFQKAPPKAFQALTATWRLERPLPNSYK